MKKLQVLMPMAGLGSRFKSKGVSTLKPLIEIDGDFMFKHALNFLPENGTETELCFVIKKTDDIDFSFFKILKNEYPEAKVVVLDSMTRGALETCYKAKDVLDPCAPLLILDCDFSFSSASFTAYLKGPFSLFEGGALVSFSSSDPRYSYAVVEDDKIIETAEKKVISSNALAGAYFFTKAHYFFDEAEIVIHKNIDIHEEYPFYVAPLFNRLIKKNLKFRLFKLESYKSFGTPEELSKVLAHE